MELINEARMMLELATHLLEGSTTHDTECFRETIDKLKQENRVKKLHIQNVSKRCFCGAEFNGSWCNSCGFDASEVDIY